MSNLLAQGKEIKRLKKEDERRQKEQEELELERGVEEKERTIEQFEKTMVGLEGGARSPEKQKSGEAERDEGRGVKRKFELDEDELLKNAKEERAKARKALDEEKVLFHGFLYTHSQLKICRLQSLLCHPSGSHHSLHLRTIFKMPNHKSCHHYVLHLRQRPSTTSLSNP